MFDTKTPWITSRAGDLIINNDHYRQAALLFMYLRKVEIQPYHKRIVHSVRRAWLWHCEQIIRSMKSSTSITPASIKPSKTKEGTTLHT